VGASEGTNYKVGEAGEADVTNLVSCNQCELKTGLRLGQKDGNKVVLIGNVSYRCS